VLILAGQTTLCYKVDKPEREMTIMTLTGRILARWVQLAALATATSLLVYLAVQQVGRQTANDPQLQIARDASAALAAGQSASAIVGINEVDIGRSLSPWITVLDERGAIVSSSARLHGSPRSVPRGVLETTRRIGEERVTWQPESGVRMATVVVHNPNGGFVIAGRSLEESEARTAAYGRLILFGWFATLIGLGVIVSATEALLPRRLISV
jgi:hypothetical protein